ncbi:MAG: shikimate kinase [Thermoplasmata archaeon]|nr:shikimate kinase [Thermoplasmata archaeon]
MHGVARASAAITVVNALPTGVGCALGIARYASASVDLTLAPEHSVECLPSKSSTPLVRASVLAALEQFAGGRHFETALRLSSEIPMAKGLKSSSAVATASILAVARACDLEPLPLEVARLAADVGRAVGVSATGALDDALAGLRAGFVITDNRRGELIAEAPIDPDWSAVLFIPPGTHPAAPSLRARFEGAREEGARAVAEAVALRFAGAMARNTRLVERLMGYDYGPLRTELLSHGAVAVGVSGLGPALAAMVPSAHVTEVMAALPRGAGERCSVRLTQELPS